MMKIIRKILAIGKRGNDTRKGAKNSTRETIEAVIIAIILALIIRTFAFQAFKIPSGSMEDTLLIGDHLLVNKLVYGIQVPHPAMVKIFGLRLPFFETSTYNIWGSVKRGDVIVFRYPNDRNVDFIKRVIAIGGDTIRVRRNVVYVNGKKSQIPQAVFKGPQVRGAIIKRDFGPYVVPDGRVFVMGDNRDRSYDSRYWGEVDINNITVPMRDILGKAMILYWSWDGIKHSLRASRLLNIIR